MEWSQVQVLARQGRGQRLGLVSERTCTRRLAETLVSLANSEGGMVILCGREPMPLTSPSQTLPLPTSRLSKPSCCVSPLLPFPRRRWSRSTRAR